MTEEDWKDLEKFLFPLKLSKGAKTEFFLPFIKILSLLFGGSNQNERHCSLLFSCAGY